MVDCWGKSNFVRTDQIVRMYRSDHKTNRDNDSHECTVIIVKLTGQCESTYRTHHTPESIIQSIGDSLTGLPSYDRDEISLIALAAVNRRLGERIFNQQSSIEDIKDDIRDIIGDLEATKPSQDQEWVIPPPDLRGAT